MGWRLAKAAHEAALAGVVSDRARLALDYMCWHARDTPTDRDPAALYWGGHLPIAMCLLADQGSTDAGVKATQRAIRELLATRLITQTQRAQNGKPSIYRIEVGSRWAPPVDKSGQGVLL